VEGGEQDQTYAALATRVLTARPRLGSVRLVAIDGFAGSGKSTFAARLAEALGAQVVHTDDLLEGWGDVVSFWPRLEEWILAPLRSGRAGRYRRYDWERGEFAEWHDVPVASALILEGVSSARAAIRPELSLSVWVDAPKDVRTARGIARDGEVMRSHWEDWQVAEEAHARNDRTADAVDLVVNGDTGPEEGHNQSYELEVSPPESRA
jgi:uridine kinase